MTRRRNSDVSTRALERAVIATGDLDSNEPTGDLVRLASAYLRETGGIDAAMDRFLELVRTTRGLGGSREAIPRTDDRALAMTEVVVLTSAVAREIERQAGLQQPDLSVYHYVFRDAGEFDKHGPACPWVRPNDFTGINIAELPDTPSGCLLIERGRYYPVYIREGASMLQHETDTSAEVMIAAQAAALSRYTVASLWLLRKVKLAARAVQSFAGFGIGTGVSQNTLLVRLRSEAERDEDNLAANWRAEDIEHCSNLTVGAWNFVTGEDAYGAVLVLQKKDLRLETRGIGAVLTHRSGDVLYTWPDDTGLDLTAAASDLERQGLLRLA